MKKIEKKAAVLGFPIKHSLSPVIHNYWIKKYKIPGKYDLFKTNKNQLKKHCLKRGCSHASPFYFIASINP